MFRSRAVAKVNPSKSCSTVLIFGIGKGFLTNLLLTSQKLLQKHTVLFFFGILNKGEAHSDAGCLSNSPAHMIFPPLLKEYARAEGVSAGFGVDLESASDLSRGIRVSETAECWEKVQHTSARLHLDLVPGGNGTGTCLMRADT